MASTYKILGQAASTTAVPINLYTVPAATQTVCSTLAICNLGIATTFRVAVRPAGSPILNKHYIVYDAAIDQYESLFLTLGLTLSSTDVVTVYAGTSDLSFSLFGSEIT